MTCVFVAFGSNQLLADDVGRDMAEKPINGTLSTFRDATLSDDKSHTIFFDFDSVELNEFAKGVLTSVIKEALDNPASEIVIKAHTDLSGPSPYNQTLSFRRAEAVKQAILEQGMKDVIISVEGLGENRPFIVTEDGIREPQNRRAEISLKTVFGAVSENEKINGVEDEMHKDQLRQSHLLQDAVLDEIPKQETARQEGHSKLQTDWTNNPFWEGWLKEVALHDLGDDPRLHRVIATWFKGHQA